MMKLSVDIIIKALLLGVIITLIVLIVAKAIQVQNSDEPVATEHAPVALSANSKVLLMGEVFWGRYIRDAALSSDLGYQYPFSGLDSFKRGSYDSWLAHIECPITDNSLTSAEQEATLTFNCRPEFLEEASKWFDVFSLANNHTDNMDGQMGLDETRQNLEEYGVQHYGHYSNSVINELCEVVELPVSVSYTNGEVRKDSFPIAMCGFHNVFELPTEQQLDVIREYSKYFLTIITPQMGQEYTPSADQFKTDTYRAMIDRGADMVVATHPHWIQNTEVYQEKLIMYSLGNFMFDQQDSEEVRRSAALDLQISLRNSEELSRWLTADLDCAEFKDSCLQEAQSLELTKPKFVLGYDVVSSLNTNYVTSLAPEYVNQRVLERLNWVQTMQQLGVDSPTN